MIPWHRLVITNWEARGQGRKREIRHALTKCLQSQCDRTFLLPPLAMSLIFLRIFLPRSFPALKWTYVEKQPIQTINANKTKSQIKLIESVNRSNVTWCHFMSRWRSHEYFWSLPNITQRLSKIIENHPEPSKDFRKSCEDGRKLSRSSDNNRNSTKAIREHKKEETCSITSKQLSYLLIIFFIIIHHTFLNLR